MQSDELVRRTQGIQAVRRRGGGGAVLIIPTISIWIDIWIPKTSMFSRIGAREQLGITGHTFIAALDHLGLHGLQVAQPTGPIEIQAACFAGIGPGEVLSAEGRKLVGITAWRSREGSLLQCALYRGPEQLLPSLLNIEISEQARLRESLQTRVANLDCLGATGIEEGDILDSLSEAFSCQGVRRPPEMG
jgi:lipoate-protein ligase A